MSNANSIMRIEHKRIFLSRSLTDMKENFPYLNYLYSAFPIQANSFSKSYRRLKAH